MDARLGNAMLHQVDNGFHNQRIAGHRAAAAIALTVAVTLAMSLECLAQPGVGDAGLSARMVESYQQHLKLAASSDGRFLAQIARSGKGVYITNRVTGKNILIDVAKELKCVDCIIDDLAISPDGAWLVFNARWFVTSEGRIYQARTDGSGLLQIAPADPSTKTNHDHFEIEDLSYSPDGTKILARVDMSNAAREGNGQPSGGDDETYIGLLSSEGIRQNPEIIAEGTPLFWSVDGAAVYYSDNRKSGTLYRLDLLTKQSAPVIGFEKTPILGRVPGLNAIFTVEDSSGGDSAGCQTNCIITIVSLDGSVVPPGHERVAESVSFRDSSGRYLESVDQVTAHQLCLVYSGGNVVRKPEMAQQHIELVSFP